MIPLKYVARVNPPTPEFEHVLAHAEIPFVPLEAVWRSGVDASRRRTRESVSTGYTRFREGDIVLPKITPTFQADRSTIVQGLKPKVAAGTTELHVIRVGAQADVRYIRYLLSSRNFLLGGAASMIGVAGQKRVPDRWLSDYPVVITNLPAQRAIADYLDTETARIDLLVGHKRRMASLISARRVALIDQVTAIGDVVPVRRLVTRLTSGPRGWAGYASSLGEQPFLRITNIRRDLIELDHSDLTRVAAPLGAEAMRTSVKENDVLVSITADIGSVAIARRVDAGSAVSQHIALMTPGDCEPEWLAYAIKSTFCRYQLDAGQYGGTKTQLSLGDIASLKIRLPSIAEQRKRLLTLRSDLQRINEIDFNLKQQLKLLVDRRQALITAAVTGELNILGAA